MLNILLQAFSAIRCCQISAAADNGSSTKGQFTQLYLPFFLYISKQDCFEKVPVSRKDLPDSVSSVGKTFSLLNFDYVSDVVGVHERDG